MGQKAQKWEAPSQIKIQASKSKDGTAANLLNKNAALNRNK